MIFRKARGSKRVIECHCALHVMRVFCKGKIYFEECAPFWALLLGMRLLWAPKPRLGAIHRQVLSPERRVGWVGQSVLLLFSH